MIVGDQEKSLVSYVEERWQKIQAHRELYCKRVIDNVAQYAGKHWSAWSIQTNRIEEMRAGRGRAAPRRTYNLQAPNTMALAQKINSRDPVFDIRPASTDHGDVYSASVAEAVQASEFRSLGMMGYLRLEFIIAALVCGDAFLKLVWEQDIGSQYGADDGREEMTGGDLQLHLRTPLEIAVDPFATNLKNARWIMEALVRPTETVEDFYNVSGLTTGAEDQTSSYQLALRSVMTNNQPLDYRPEEDVSLVKEFWEAPTRKHPKGRVLTICNGKVLDYKETNPYGEFPWVHYGAIPMIGRFWSKSPIEMGTPAQQGMEVAMAQIEEYHMRAVPKILAPEQSLGKDNDLNNIPFEVIYYKQGRPAPTIERPPEMSGEAYKFVDTFIGLFDKVWGLSAATMGRQTPNTRSGELYDAQVEADHQKFAPFIFRFESTMEDLCKKIIRFNQKFRSFPKLLEMTGNRKGYQLAYFSKADLTGNFDIGIVKGSMLPVSKQQTFGMVQAALQMGVYGDPKSKEAMFAVKQRIEPGSYQLDAFANTDPDQKTAEKENAEMLQGRQPKPPAEWEDHTVHFMIHNGERKQPDYKNRSETVRKLFIEHLELTAMMASQGAQAMAPAQQMPQAPPGLNMPPGMSPQGAPPPGTPPMPAETGGMNDV